jgi:hypothetical protein
LNTLLLLAAVPVEAGLEAVVVRGVTAQRQDLLLVLVLQLR